MSNICRNKVTINLAVESVDSLKQRASKLKNVDCPPEFIDPCIKRLQVVPAPIRKIKKKQIEICKCPTVQFICPPVPCVCPPCPICPTPFERLKYLLKTGMKATLLYVMAKWTIDNQLWGSSDYTSRLTNYYTELINSLLYGEDKGLQMAESSPPGFFEIRKAVYYTQVMWNKIISSLFYVTIGMPLQYMYKVKEMMASDDEEGEDEEET